MCMVTIGEIRMATIERPGDPLTKKVIHVPNPEYSELWGHVYNFLNEKTNPSSPLGNDYPKHINPYFGYFGEQFHPILRQPHHFHLGIDLASPIKKPVYSSLEGILEYSGFHVGNGNYVMISHPDIVTEDGFMLYTLYMHLRDLKVGFSKYQKMLREISLRSYPNISITRDTLIGTVGESGNAKGMYPHVHLQCEFRHKDGTIIAIDPAPILGIESQVNRTATLNTEEEFLRLYETDKKNICDHCVEKYWK